MAMHSNWNPWHGCIKCSEGCQNCYVYYIDSMQKKNSADIYRTKTEFGYPLARDRKNRYKIQSGPSLTVVRKQISARPCNHWLGGDSSFQKMLYGVFYFKISFSFLFSSFGW